MEIFDQSDTSLVLIGKKFSRNIDFTFQLKQGQYLVGGVSNKTTEQDSEINFHPKILDLHKGNQQLDVIKKNYDVTMPTVPVKQMPRIIFG